MLMNFETSVSPHIRARDDAQRIMWWVVFSLLFPIVAATWFFGFKALLLVVFTTVAAVFAEAAFQRVLGKPVTIRDGSAAVTGILLALVLPPTLPLWMAGIGAIAAVVLVKGLFGGLGIQHLQPGACGPRHSAGLLAGRDDHLDLSCRFPDHGLATLPGEDA